MVVRVSSRTEDGFVSEIKKLDSQLNELLKIVSQVRPPTPAGTWPMHTPRIQFHIAPNGHIVWGNETRYEFFVVDEQGKVVKRIINDYDHLKITALEKKQMIETIFEGRGVPGGRKLTFPDNFHPFGEFLIDDEGRIIAYTYKHTPERIRIYDIFDSDGRFLVSVPLKKFPQVWKQNKIYFLESDDEGYQYIERYQVTWNY